MYEGIVELLAQNGARLIYTTSRPVGSALDALAGEYPSLHGEVSTNEKIGFELALTGAVAAKRTACIFTTDGLYKALDPLMTSAYTGVIGGFLVVCIREIDEEVTPLGPFSKIPVMVVESPEALARAVAFAYDASERHQMPFIIQATPECDPGAAGRKARNGTGEAPVSKPAGPSAGTAQFSKDPSRWAALPQSRYRLHGELNEKIERIRREFENYAGNSITRNGKTGLITDRTALSDLYEDETSIFHVETVFPLPTEAANRFIDEMDEVFVSDGPYPSIEMQLRDRSKVAREPVSGGRKKTKKDETMFGFLVVRDKLGPASAINMAHGMVKQQPDLKVLAITFEDHFFHSGMPSLVNSIYNGSSYVLLILTHEREGEIKRLLGGWGFKNCFSISGPQEVEQYKDAPTLTVLLCKGII
ncbi:MAG TPA: hypothetical protein VGJ94_09600 [Syntrophorhabdaceae bacterium]|jgi:TPP-dependent indolepyruvate ferredoxin oxidoreductase alpha subunit